MRVCSLATVLSENAFGECHESVLIVQVDAVQKEVSAMAEGLCAST